MAADDRSERETLRVTASVRIPLDEIAVRYETSGGAGGQHANRSHTRVELAFDVAASLVTRPELLVLDEPTTGLDPRSRQVVWTSIRDLVAEGVTLLLTTQYLEEADVLADSIVLIDHGRAVAAGTPSELKSQIGDQRVDVVAVDGPGGGRA